MAEHTPGDWQCEETEDGHEIRMGSAIMSPGNCLTHHLIEYEHGCVPDFDNEDDPETQQFLEAEANANLIAAAPDLLAACRSALGPVLTFAVHYCGKPEKYPPYIQLKAAIDKAEGHPIPSEDPADAR